MGSRTAQADAYALNNCTVAPRSMDDLTGFIRNKFSGITMCLCFKAPFFMTFLLPA